MKENELTVGLSLRSSLDLRRITEEYEEIQRWPFIDRAIMKYLFCEGPSRREYDVAKRILEKRGVQKS